ncbi:hypothetical protein SAMN04515620_13436 [Collimonas sp. OK607]|nr:hypothetical protein SAMN04515620_13436 [Collimonas sp. OK607]
MKNSKSISATIIKLLATSAIVLSLSACGGGGGGSTGSGSSTGSGTTTPSPVVNQVVNPTDPVTNAPTTSPATNQLSGVVVSAATQGAIVTAYNVRDDGSNGTLLGTSAATDVDGKFSMTLSSAPAGMVRLVATGGSFVSEADATKQPNKALELVTPYVTTDFNFFVITPATHIASQVLASTAAKGGITLGAAFNASSMAGLGIGRSNTFMSTNQHGGIDYLKVVPGSSDDPLHSYLDLLSGLEWFGVRYDLPSSVVLQAVAQSAQGNYAANAVDAAGNPVQVGKWNNGVFDPTAPMTLDQGMAWKNADGSNQMINGVLVHDQLVPFISLDMIQTFYRVAACASDAAKPDLYKRYPSDSNLFAGDPATVASACTYFAKQISDLKASIKTNNRSSMK